MPSQFDGPKMLLPGLRPLQRGYSLIEVLVALVILTVIFVFVTGDMTAISHQDKAADQTIEISAANYFLGFMKSDSNFWAPDWGTGPSDLCKNPLGPYTDTYPSPPAQPAWRDFVYCDQEPAFAEPGPSASPLAFQYMWSASQRVGNTDAADLTVWVRRDASSPIFEYHALRYRSASVNPPTPYPPSPTPNPSPTTPPSPGPSPSPHPTPSRPPTPTPTPPPFGI